MAGFAPLDPPLDGRSLKPYNRLSNHLYESVGYNGCVCLNFSFLVLLLILRRLLLAIRAIVVVAADATTATVFADLPAAAAAVAAIAESTYKQTT